MAEDDVLAIQPAGGDGGDEELGAIGVGTSVGHGQDTRAGVLESEVLILELVAYVYRTLASDFVMDVRLFITHRRWTCHQYR